MCERGAWAGGRGGGGRSCTNMGEFGCACHSAVRYTIVSSPCFCIPKLGRVIGNTRSQEARCLMLQNERTNVPCFCTSTVLKLQWRRAETRRAETIRWLLDACRPGGKNDWATKPLPTLDLHAKTTSENSTACNCEVLVLGASCGAIKPDVATIHMKGLSCAEPTI